MSDRWFTDVWAQQLGNADQLLADARHNSAELANDRIAALLQAIEQDRNEAETTLQRFGEQRAALLAALDDLQRELAVAGRPVTGEIS